MTRGHWPWSRVTMKNREIKVAFLLGKSVEWAISSESEGLATCPSFCWYDNDKSQSVFSVMPLTCTCMVWSTESVMCVTPVLGGDWGQAGSLHRALCVSQSGRLGSWKAGRDPVTWSDQHAIMHVLPPSYSLPLTTPEWLQSSMPYCSFTLSHLFIPHQSYWKNFNLYPLQYERQNHLKLVSWYSCQLYWIEAYVVLTWKVIQHEKNYHVLCYWFFIIR